MTMLSFREAFDLLRAVRDRLDPRDTVNLQLDAWADDDGATRVKWQVWSANRKKHYEGASARLVVAAYEADHDDALTNEVLASAGDGPEPERPSALADEVQW